MFYNILQNAKGIDNFFDSMFSFLRRKTDFFLVADESQKKNPREIHETPLQVHS